MNINPNDMANTGMTIDEIEHLFEQASKEENAYALNSLTKILMPIVSDAATRMFSRANFIEYDTIVLWAKDGLALSVNNYDGICNFSTYSRAVIAGVILDRIRGKYKDIM